jgi:hypothetical protein
MKTGTTTSQKGFLSVPMLIAIAVVIVAIGTTVYFYTRPFPQKPNLTESSASMGTTMMPTSSTSISSSTNRFTPPIPTQVSTSTNPIHASSTKTVPPSYVVTSSPTMFIAADQSSTSWADTQVLIQQCQVKQTEGSIDAGGEFEYWLQPDGSYVDIVLNNQQILALTDHPASFSVLRATIESVSSTCAISTQLTIFIAN